MRLWRRHVSVQPGSVTLQPYISLPMRRSRFGKRKERDTTPVAIRPYRDRASYALDAQLASLASAGDDSAFTPLVTRFQPAGFRWALIFAQDADEAEDITQEVFVRAHRQLGQY